MFPTPQLAHVVLSDASAGADLRQLIEALHAHAMDALARGYALRDALAARGFCSLTRYLEGEMPHHDWRSDVHER